MPTIEATCHLVAAVETVTRVTDDLVGLWALTFSDRAIANRLESVQPLQPRPIRRGRSGYGVPFGDDPFSSPRMLPTSCGTVGAPRLVPLALVVGTWA